MEISERTITALGDIVTGDEQLSPYCSGPKLVKLFNEYGANDVYKRGFPSRWKYAENKIRELNGTGNLSSLICEIYDPREFMDTEFEIEEALDFANKRLEYDGYEIFISNGFAKIRQIDGEIIEFKSPYENSEDEKQQFIEEQIAKSEDKILEEDYDGAITNARSLVEAVLTDIESDFEDNPPSYDGDVLKLYKRVKKYLNLDPANPNIDNSLKQTLTGLISILNGIASISNKMGDRHVRSYKPSKHHAILIVNSARTFCKFMYDSELYQSQRAAS
jgi:hypothetical protein